MKEFNRNEPYNNLLLLPPKASLEYLIDAGLGTPKTVGNYLNDMEDAGFLTSEKVGKEKLYLNFKLMEILEKS